MNELDAILMLLDTSFLEGSQIERGELEALASWLERPGFDQKLFRQAQATVVTALANKGLE